MIGYLKGVLEDQNIACLIKNELLQGATGEIPPQEAWPEIWVQDDRDECAAKALIEQLLMPGEETNNWHCPNCGEWIESQFSECWRCNTSRPMRC